MAINQQNTIDRVSLFINNKIIIRVTIPHWPQQNVDRNRINDKNKKKNEGKY